MFAAGEQLNIVLSLGQRPDRADTPRPRLPNPLLGGDAARLLGHWARALGSRQAPLRLRVRPSARSSKARHKRAHKEKDTEHVSKDPFGDISKGPLFISVSINQQKLHLYSDGVHVADESVATGVPGHATPMGVFNIIQSDRFPPLEYLQQCADAVHGAHHLVRCGAA